ncbi:hypothetical protein J6590_020769 [Homalodisca vitripennis]|nr:hypothetical protein J6590_020769 [Homalodisca vitripennis]
MAGQTDSDVLTSGGGQHSGLCYSLNLVTQTQASQVIYDILGGGVDGRGRSPSDWSGQ